MIAAVWMFLAGLTVGGLAVWVLLSYTAISPAQPQEPSGCWTVQSISARIERERLAANRIGLQQGRVG